MSAIAVPSVFALGLVAGLLLAVRDAPPAAATAPVVAAPGAPRYPADVMRVIDGDTFEARVRAWPGIDIATKVRLRDIDAPELAARCAGEAELARAARDALVALLAEGAVSIARVGLDKYGGRVLADAATGRTTDVASALLARGHARPYAGGRRQAWCDR